MKLDKITEFNIQNWNKIHQDKEYIENLLKENPQQVLDAFYKNLEFGTGGLRGLMGIGTNRVNSYTIRIATQAFANHLKKEYKNTQISITIGFDTRSKSQDFAEEAAKVLAGNQIHVYLSKNPIPTPLVSYGCRQYRCKGAIMITASHNPPTYNGYKVYGEDGGQVLPPHDVDIIHEFNQVAIEGQIFQSADLQNPYIHLFDKELLNLYIEELYKQQLYPESNSTHGNELNIIYSSLHGTGINAVPEALKSWNFTHLEIISEQANIDGNFTTIDYPNPELKEALSMGIQKLIATNADLFFATDPDADRLGVVINNHGKEMILSGNEIACLCIHHICSSLKSKGFDFSNMAVIKSVVTTELFVQIASDYHLSCHNVLPGFKYIAQLIEKWEKENSLHYLFGCEESLGYLYGTFTRDKDAISACNLICEMALQAKLRGKTLKDVLIEISKKYGVYDQTVKAIHFDESKEGHDKIKNIIQLFIDTPPKTIAGKEVIILEDYLKGIKKDFHRNVTTSLQLPKSNLLIFFLEDQTKLMIRPSGTEPKIKIYCEVHRKIKDKTYDETKVECKLIAKEYIASIEQLIDNSPYAKREN